METFSGLQVDGPCPITGGYKPCGGWEGLQEAVYGHTVMRGKQSALTVKK